MLGNSLVDKLLGNEKISTNYTAQIDEAFKRIKKGDSFAKAMDSLEIPYSLTQSLNDYVNSTDRAKLSAEEFAASNASAMKSVSKTSSSVSVASKAITGLSTVLKTTVGVLANMAIGFAIGAAITGVIKLFDALHVSAEEASEAMDISFSGYEDAKAQVESINSELDSTNARISELQSKGSLTFVEKSELANLKEARKELELQQDLAEKAETKAAKDAGNKALQAYEKSFGDFEVSQDKINEYLRDTDITRNNASLFADENNISALIAGIQQMKELQREAKSEGDLEEVERYQGIIDDTTDSIWNQVTSLENYKSKLSEIPETLRTKEQAGALKEISDTIDFVYKKLDPNKWKELKFDEILSSDDSFSDAVDDLERQSKAAGDAGISVSDLKNKYPELASAITGAGMSLSDFVEEINAQAQGIETATTDIEALESSFRTFQVSAVDAINQVDTLNAVLANSFSGKGLEISYEESEDGVVSLTGDIVNLQNAYKGLEGYDLLFERTANGVQVNREALRALQAQQEANQKSSFAQKELELQDQLTLAYQRLKEAQTSGDSVAAADQQNVISTLQSQIENVQLLSSAYDGATSAYQKWLSAQSNGEAGDMYRTVSETMKERGEELYKEGRYNTEEFRAIADYYSNQDLSTASMEEVVAAYQNAATARDRYFTGTKEGIDNFIYDAQQKVPEMFETITDETGKEKIKFNIDDEDLANKMNLSVEAIQNILDAATEYEDDFIIGDSSSAEELAQKLAEATQKADEAKTKLKELQDQGKISTDIEFDVDVSKLDEAGIDERITELTDLKNHLIEINADASQIEYVDQLLNEANARKDQLAQQTNVDVSVNINNEEDLATLGEKLSNLPKDETSNVSINIQNESQLDGVVQQIEQVPKDTSVNLSLTVQNQEQADALESKLENLKSEGHSIDYKVNIVPGDTGALDSTIQDGSVNVTATVTGNEQVSQLKSNIDSLSDKTVKVTVSADGAGNIDSIKENLSSIPLLKSTSVTASVTGKESVQALTEAISKVLGKSVNVNAKVSGTDDVNELVAAIAKVMSKYVTVSATTSGTSSVNALASAIAGVNSKTVTVTTNNVTNNITNNSVRQLASGTLLSPALVSGTAYNVINTTPAYANGNVSLSRDETALINELGTESIIRNGRWFLVPGGMHLENVKKGDIILNAKQTQDLLKSGKASGRGKAYADGTLGNVRNLAATSLLDAYSSGSWVFGDTGNGNLKGTGSTYKPSSSTNKATQSVNKAASNLSSAAKSTSSAAKETSEAAEKLSDTLSGYTDWIERVFEARERELEHLESQLDNIAHLPDRQAKSYEILAKNREYINNTQTAKQTYQSHLDMLESQMGLNPIILNQIRSGSFDISKYDDETQKLISEYQEYYDKLQDCSAQYDQLIAQQEEYAQTVLDNISDYYDMMNGVDESAMGWLEGQRELWENQGKNNDFGNQYSSIRNSMVQQQKVSDRLQKQVDDFAAEIERLISEGYMQRYSQQYFEAHETLNGFKQELYESQSALIEFEDQLRELDYTAIQNKIDGFAQAVDKISAQVNLMEARDQKVPESVYQQQIDANNNQIAANQQLRASKLKEQGLYDVGSTRYQELAEEINDLDVETLNLMADNEALKDSIYELRFANLDNQIEAYGKLKDEINDFRSLLNEDAFFAKNGGLTEEGLAELALLQQGIAASKNEIADYREGLEKLKKSYANGVISLDEYNEKSEEYCAGIRDSIKDVSDYEDALTDLYMTQMRTENEALQEVIDKRREALQAKKSYYEYDKTLKSQTKSVNMLRAEIAALQGVNLFFIKVNNQF